MADDVDETRPNVQWPSDFLLTKAIREGLRRADESVERLILKNATVSRFVQRPKVR